MSVTRIGAEHKKKRKKKKAQFELILLVLPVHNFFKASNEL